MKTTAVLAFLLCWILPLVSQELSRPQAQAQCEFSGGSTIRVTHNSERKKYEFATDEDLLTVKGMSVPAGEYAVLPVKDPRYENWTLRVQPESGRSDSPELPPLPMSVIRRLQLNRLDSHEMPVVTFTVSFEHTGRSCMMHWRSEKPNVVLSLEFTEKNTDMTVQP